MRKKRLQSHSDLSWELISYYLVLGLQPSFPDTNLNPIQLSLVLVFSWYFFSLLIHFLVFTKPSHILYMMALAF